MTRRVPVCVFHSLAPEKACEGTCQSRHRQAAFDNMTLEMAAEGIVDIATNAPIRTGSSRSHRLEIFHISLRRSVQKVSCEKCHKCPQLRRFVLA